MYASDFSGRPRESQELHGGWGISPTRARKRLNGGEGQILAVHAHFAEVEQNAPAIGGAPETHLRAEAGEQKDLIKLTRDDLVAGAGQNFVEDHFAFGI